MMNTAATRESFSEIKMSSVRPGGIPLPRRFARAKAWSARSRSGHVSVDSIKLMLSAERDNRG
jgi:hypothetical protein